MIFFKPTIKSKLVNNGKEVKVSVKNATQKQVIIMLYLTMREVANIFKVPARELMNGVISLDKSIVRIKKNEERSAKYHK